MSPSPLTPSQAAALRRARELAAELAHLAAAVRAALRENRPPAAPELAALAPEPVDSALAPGEMRAAFAAANGGGRRGPRELFPR